VKLDRDECSIPAADDVHPGSGERLVIQTRTPVVLREVADAGGGLLDCLVGPEFGHVEPGHPQMCAMRKGAAGEFTAFEGRRNSSSGMTRREDHRICCEPGVRSRCEISKYNFDFVLFATVASFADRSQGNSRIAKLSIS